MSTEFSDSATHIHQKYRYWYFEVENAKLPCVYTLCFTVDGGHAENLLVMSKSSVGIQHTDTDNFFSHGELVFICVCVCVCVCERVYNSPWLKKLSSDILCKANNPFFLSIMQVFFYTMCEELQWVKKPSLCWCVNVQNQHHCSWNTCIIQSDCTKLKLCRKIMP
jgi:hypothetical protein